MLIERKNLITNPDTIIDKNGLARFFYPAAPRLLWLRKSLL
jgi:hypothetical protein